MGIIKQGSDDFDAMVAAWRAVNPTATRAQLRKYIASAVTRGQEMLAKRDAQDAAAPAAFADLKAGQFKAFTDALPDPTLSTPPAVDPTES